MQVSLSFIGPKKKSKAEYQKEYRERQKNKHRDAYLQKERERKKQAYVQSNELNKRDLERRRKRNRLRMKKYREQKKLQDAQQNLSKDIHSTKRTSSRKRISRAISKANRKLAKLEHELIKSNRKVWKLKKRVQKLKKLQNTTPPNQTQRNVRLPTTPMSSAVSEMRRCGLDPSRFYRVRRQLQFYNVLVDEIKSINNPDLVSSIVSGKISKRYRMMSYTSRVFGIRRKSLKSSKSLQKVLKRRLPLIQEQIHKTVSDFLHRGDNSSVMPGKSDYKTVDGKQNQKRILADHMKNLFLKFRFENMNISMSYSRFCKYRPKHFCLVSYATRNTCLCIKHQNMALKLRCLHKAGLITTDSPDIFIKDITDNFDVESIFPMNSGPFEYHEWTRVNTDAGQRMNILTKTGERAAFLKLFKTQLFEFKDHVERVRNQYHALQALKADLPPHHFIAQMDFAENFNCKTSDEVQSSYFNKCLVSLHPVVVYYSINGVLHHKNFTFISNDLNHNATFVFSVISRLVPLIKNMDPEASCIHYWTDSPTSQYRNKHIFSVIRKHKEHLDINCTWDYFEAGHGKGPCDGIGGTVKRCADLAIKQRKVNIQSASDFHSWTADSNLAITFKYISKDDISRYGIVLNETIAKNCKPVKGTMKLHSVRTDSTGSIFIRDMSCYCTDCLALTFCAGWKRV